MLQTRSFVRSFVRSIFVFKICWKIQFFSEFQLIMPIFIHFFSIFWRFKTRNFERNHRQGSRSGSRNRAWTKTFFWCILKRDKDSKNPGFQDLRFRSKTRHFQVWNCVKRCSLSYFYSDFKFEIVSVDVIWWNFMHFYADFKFEIVSIDAMCRMRMRFQSAKPYRSMWFETKSFYYGFMLYSGIHYVVVAAILLR